MINPEKLHRFKKLWPLIVVSGAIMSTAFIVDWIGLSSPRDFSHGQIMLIVIGLLMLVTGWLGRRIVSLYRGVALLLLNTLVIIVCLEIVAPVALRVLDMFPDAPPSETELPYYKSQEWATEYWREFYASTSNRYVPWVVWRRRPFSGNTININQDGIRLTPGAECGLDSYKVFVFGGSTIWGEGAPDWGTIPAYLQAGLESMRDEPVCVVNFGEAGFVSTQGLMGLLIQLRSGNVPDLVIFYDGINEVFAGAQSGQGGVHQNLNDIAERFKRSNNKHPLIVWLNRFYLTALIKRFLPEELLEVKRETLTYENLGVDAETVADSVVQAYLGNYELVDALAQHYGFEYYFFWQPSILVGNKPLTEEERIFRSELDHFSTVVNLFMPTYQRIEQVAGAYPNLHNIADAFDKVDHQLWVEHTHVTPEGNQLIAQEMLNVINNLQQQASK